MRGQTGESVTPKEITDLLDATTFAGKLVEKLGKHVVVLRATTWLERFPALWLEIGRHNGQV